ncbi:MAG: cell division protein FtsZ, partial [Bacteroidales bacterium]
AAQEKREEIKKMLSDNTKMLFITAGMGGGTGTGAAPVIASIAKEIEVDDEVKKILTVAIVTTPFSFEGRKREMQAKEGIAELRKYVDAILVINNDKLREYGNMTMNEAFATADDVLSTAAKGISEIITVSSYVQIDFKDVNTVMNNSGVALMGFGSAAGEGRAKEAAMKAMDSPLLNDNSIEGAQNMLLYIAYSNDMPLTMDEIEVITKLILSKAGDGVDLIWGAGADETLGENLNITLIATGFNEKSALHERTVERIRLETEIPGTYTKTGNALKVPLADKTMNPSPVSVRNENLTDISIKGETNAMVIPNSVEVSSFEPNFTKEVPIQMQVDLNFEIQEKETPNLEKIPVVAVVEKPEKLEKEEKVDNDLLDGWFSQIKEVTQKENTNIDLASCIEKQVGLELDAAEEMECSQKSKMQAVVSQTIVAENTTNTPRKMQASWMREVLGSSVSAEEQQGMSMAEIRRISDGMELVDKTQTSVSTTTTKLSENENSSHTAILEEKGIYKERMDRLRVFRNKLKTPEGLEQIENIPAYIRQHIQIDPVVPSSVSEANLRTITKDGRVTNNSFLHDNVD